MVTKLEQLGITDAFALKGGTDAWKNAGLPMGSAKGGAAAEKGTGSPTVKK